jgi:hypothetical protein
VDVLRQPEHELAAVIARAEGLGYDLARKRQVFDYGCHDRSQLTQGKLGAWAMSRERRELETSGDICAFSLAMGV